MAFRHCDVICLPPGQATRMSTRKWQAAGDIAISRRRKKSPGRKIDEKMEVPLLLSDPRVALGRNIVSLAQAARVSYFSTRHRQD